MKTTFICVTVVVIAVARCFSAALPSDPREYPTLIVHQKAMGSGCILQLSNSVYLVTAKHVLFAEPEGTNAPTLLSSNAVVKSYSRVGRTNASERVLTVDLARLLVAGEIRSSTNRDVALVRIQQCNPTNLSLVRVLPGVLVVSSDVGLTQFDGGHVGMLNGVDVGADVYMFGYPISLTGPIAAIFSPSEPLLRKGCVAGVNLGTRKIIIDCPAYFGNSGGPVVQVDDAFPVMRRFRIIGLVSGFVPFEELWENKTLKYSHVIKSNSGYTVVEPIETALELAWK